MTRLLQPRMLVAFMFVGFFAAAQAQTDAGGEAATDASQAEAASGAATDPDALEDEDPYFIDRTGEHCINIRSIRNTRVLDERTVLFFMRGGDIYANYLSYRCPSLVREKRFSYELATSQLCSVDVITVLEGFGSSLRQGMPCGLGMFYPVTEEDVEILTGEPGGALNPPIVITNPAEGEGAEPNAEQERSAP